MGKTERLIAVLEYLTSGEPAPTHGELMQRLDIRRSTLSDMLGDLRRLGFVDVVDRRYIPGLRLLAFVHRAAHQSTLKTEITPVLESLAQSTGESAVYIVRAGGHGTAPEFVIAVAHVESKHPVRYVGKIGEPFPIDTTAAGHVFLAFGEQDRQARTEIDSDLESELARVRKQGFAIVERDSRISISAPVLSPGGVPLGAVTVVGPTDRLRGREASIGRELLEQLAKLKQKQKDAKL